VLTPCTRAIMLMAYSINIKKWYKQMKIKHVTPVLAAFAVLATPVLASAAVDTDNTTINATIGSTITMTTSGTVALAITPDGDGQASSASDTVTVSTNNAGGYYLTLADSDATTTLANGANNLTAHAGTQGTPTTLANNTWGYRVDSVGGFGAGPTSAQTDQNNLALTWAGVPATGSPNTLKTTATTATNDTTTVWYGAKADTTKPNGVYTGTVTYTATTN
jgi:hypothetical protein